MSAAEKLSETSTVYTDIRINRYGTTIVVFDRAPDDDHFDDGGEPIRGNPGEPIVADSGDNINDIARRLLGQLPPATDPTQIPGGHP
jgi:hypothetical protein